MRDLFEQDNGGWLQDAALLDRLGVARLTAKAEKLRAEGWKWIEVAIEFPHGHAAGLCRLTGAAAKISAEEQARQRRAVRGVRPDERGICRRKRRSSRRGRRAARRMEAGAEAIRRTRPAVYEPSRGRSRRCLRHPQQRRHGAGRSAATSAARTRSRPKASPSWCRCRARLRVPGPIRSSSGSATIRVSGGRDRRRGGRDQAAVRTARRRTDGAPDGGIPRCAGGRSRDRLRRGAARSLPEGVLRLSQRLLPGDRCQEHQVFSAGAGACRVRRSQGDRRQAGGLGKAVTRSVGNSGTRYRPRREVRGRRSSPIARR